jgi:hypothetical protein
MKEPFAWDPYSDQPYQLKARGYKKAMRKKEALSLLRTMLYALLALPLSWMAMPFLRKKESGGSDFFGLGVNLDKEPSLTPALVEELGVTSLLVRLPLWEMERLDAYTGFVRRFRDKKIVLNVMQDREHIEDPSLLEKDLDAVFSEMSPYVNRYQIGTTINRAKWGFFSVNEYLRFFRVAYDLKEKRYPGLELIGPSVIDFEYHFAAHALFSPMGVRFDALSALLYVDRRGAPENTQMGFGLAGKIGLLAAMARLSPKTPGKIYITETNWPLTGTAPYAPTSEHECVDEERYADYMVRYYLIALATGHVSGVYWHQLIAPGYGLIDNRGGIRKRSAFAAFRTMVSHLGQAEVLDYTRKNGRHTLSCRNGRGQLQVIWAEESAAIAFEKEKTFYTRDGEEKRAAGCTAGPSPLYLYLENN